MEENDAGGIRCSEVLEVLSDYVDGELPEPLRARITAHVAECGNCARFGGSFAALVGSLGKAQPEESIAPETWAAVMRAISR